jgi:MoxR-like ATPase
VGSSASGKSTAVRVLANIAGKTLRTLPVTSAMDTTDILGGFEQVSLLYLFYSVGRTFRCFDGIGIHPDKKPPTELGDAESKQMQQRLLTSFYFSY